MKRLFLLLAVLCGLQAIMAGPASGPAAAAIADASFVRFWDRFRDDLLREDWAALAPHIRWPLLVAGELDDVPVRRVPQARIAKTMRTLITAPTGLKPNETNADVLRLPPPENAVATASFARIGDMEFQKKDGAWRLTKIYLPRD